MSKWDQYVYSYVSKQALETILSEGLYAPDVPHASIHCNNGIIPAKYIEKMTKKASNEKENKKLSHAECLKILEAAKERIKSHDAVTEIFEKHGIDINEIDDIPVCFADIDVSARTDHGIIYLNWGLLDEGFPKNDHYLAHELTHYAQQTTGDGPTKGSTDDTYLDNEYEQEGFQVQTDYLSETKGDDVADKYIDQVLDYHDVPKSERSEKKKELLHTAAHQMTFKSRELEKSISFIKKTSEELTPEDVSKLKTLVLSPPSNMRDFLKSYKTISAIVVIAKNNITDDYIGWALLRYSPDKSSYLDKLDVYVSPEYRNKDLGRVLSDEILKYIGTDKVHTDLGDDGSEDFYQKVLGDHGDFWDDPYEEEIEKNDQQGKLFDFAQNDKKVGPRQKELVEPPLRKSKEELIKEYDEAITRGPQARHERKSRLRTMIPGTQRAYVRDQLKQIMKNLEEPSANPKARDSLERRKEMLQLVLSLGE